MRGLSTTLCLLGVMTMPAHDAAGERFHIELEAAEQTIGVGRVVHLHAQAYDKDGTPAHNVQLLPVVNDRRWGHHEVTDIYGRARFMVPLPRAGQASIRLLGRAVPGPAPEKWIWHGPQGREGTVYLQRTITLPARPRSARLWVAADDRAECFVNRHRVGEKGGWHDCEPFTIPPEWFIAGDNVISVEAENAGGPAGVLLRLEFVDGEGNERVIAGNAQWRGYDERPPTWPMMAREPGDPVEVMAEADGHIISPEPWPTLNKRDLLWTGGPAPAEGDYSNSITVEVRPRELHVPERGPHGTRFGVQWEPWFTPLNSTWSTAYAVPLLGFYGSLDRDAHRQHLIWFIESGIDYIMADWSNHIWFLDSWDKIGPGSREILEATTLMMDEMAALRDEGVKVPQMSLLIGISHIEPPAGPATVNGQLDHIWRAYIEPEKYRGLWQMHEGKPLVSVLDLGMGYFKRGIELDERFTLRWTTSQNDRTGQHELGAWTWMDWQRPAITMRNGWAEAATVSIGSFGPGGWLSADSRGHRNGATLAEDFAHVLEHRPEFVQLHQFNEFTGQPEGSPVGEPKVYLDSYSVEFSDDFEPVSPTAAAYRGEGGWGFFALNQVRALIHMYRAPEPQTTLIAIAEPSPARPGHTLTPVVEGAGLELKWVTVGRPAESYTVRVGGREVARGLTKQSAFVALGDLELAPGRLEIEVIGEGTRAHFRLAEDHAEPALEDPVPARGRVTIDWQP